jgi:hypothetical protein
VNEEPPAILIIGAAMAAVTLSAFCAALLWHLS